MTEPTPDEPGRGPDDPDLDDPLTAADILGSARDPELQSAGAKSATESQASRLVALALGRYRLVRGDDGRPYATEHDGPAIAHTLRGRDALRTRLAHAYHDMYSAAPGGSALTDALTVLEGHAERADPEPVALRVASTGDGSIALDLGTTEGRCVLVDRNGWRVAPRAPVLFRRSALTAQLPEPRRGGSLDPLQQLLNVDEAGFRLIVGWLVAALLPDLPHPILALIGEQGTAKSTAARLVVSLVDPSPAPLRTPPREMRSWAAAAAASWVVALDNVSTIPPWLSDTLCKAVTGDGIVERALHTDDDINVLSFRRCIALTSIDAGRLAGDLAERLMTVELARIPTAVRRLDADIATAYDAAKPALLGALLDLTSNVLDELPAVTLDELPRMADFARVLGALDVVCGWTTVADYTAAVRDASQAVLESDPIAEAIYGLVGRGGGWRGTASELLDRITPDRPPVGWPRTPHAMRGAITRLAPALRANGVTVESARTGHDRRRVLTLRGTERGDVSEPAPTSASSASSAVEP